MTGLKQVCTGYKQRATTWIYIQMLDFVFSNLTMLLGELGAPVCILIVDIIVQHLP